MLPSASVNDMIALEDFGRGAADSAVFVNDHNPFHVNGTRRAGTGIAMFCALMLWHVILCYQKSCYVMSRYDYELFLKSLSHLDLI